MTRLEILIVEDETIVALDLQTRLDRLGYGSRKARSGAQALALVAERCPALILMDIRLDGPMDGIQAATEIRAKHEVPVIYLTANSDSDTLARAKITRPLGYLTKPVEERELRAAIEIAFYRHQTELRLRKMERWLATTLNSIGDAVIATDLDQRITFMNPVAERLTGWAKLDAIGEQFPKVFRVFLHPEDKPIQSPAARAITLGLTVELDEGTCLRAKDGTVSFIDDSAAPIRDHDGTITGAVVVFRARTSRMNPA